MAEPEQTKLEQVEGALNKKDDRYFFRRRSRLTEEQPVHHEDWHDSGEFEETMKKKNTLATKVFILSLIFFAGAVAFAFYKMQGGENFVSGKNIDMTLTGPLGVKGGDEVSLQLQIVNNNEVALEVSELVINYPAGTRSPDDPDKEMSQVIEDLGDIMPRQVINKTIRAVLFGEEKSDQEIKTTLEYHLPGSGAIYMKPVSYHVVIDAAPVTLMLTAPDAVTSGDEAPLHITVTSNTGKLIPAMRVKVNYPPGFIFSSAAPSPVSGTNNIWALGDITASSTREITINGKMTGQDNDTKAFQVIAGTGTGGNSKEITLVYNSLFKKISLKKPFLGINVAIGGKTDDSAVAEGAEPIIVSIGWSNNTDMTLTDCSITSDLGGVLDKREVKPDTKGNYFSAANRVIWDANSLDHFKVVSPGDSGSQTLVIASLPLVSGTATVKKPSVTIYTVFACSRVSDDDAVDKHLTTAVDRAVRINSAVKFDSLARYFTGPFLNTGPFPPKGETETSYTITWSLTNTSNDVQSAAVSATLSPHASWMDKSVGDGTLTYDPKTKMVNWTIGTLKAGAGYDSPAKQISFQVSVKPTLISVGSMVDIVGQATFTGIDDFTKAERRSIKDKLTTELPFDPGRPKDMEGKVE